MGPPLNSYQKMSKYPVDKSETEWQEQLDDMAFHVLRNKGTERPFTGAYDLHFEDGKYHCKGCGTLLFTSTHKYNSGCGWPAFDQAEPGSIEYIRDTTHGMIRTETVCANCGGHLGHVFNDGPRETTGQRYCINSASLHFNKETE